jgi:hypothetical protein
MSPPVVVPLSDSDGSGVGVRVGGGVSAGEALGRLVALALGVVVGEKAGVPDDSGVGEGVAGDAPAHPAAVNTRTAPSRR